MKFQLKCKGLSGDISIVEVSESDRIDDIKRNLSKKLKIKYENIGFLYRNQFLFNNKFVSDYQIRNDEIVVYFEYEDCMRYSISGSVDDRLKELKIINIDNENNKMTRVSVKCFTLNKFYNFDFPKVLMVLHLKQKLANMMNANLDKIAYIEYNRINLQFNNEFLSDKRTLESYDVEDNVWIMCTISDKHVCHHCCYLSLLPLTDGYDKLELREVSNTDQIINEIHDRYKIDKINIRLYKNADKTRSIFNINDICINYDGVPIVYYLIEYEITKYEICTKLGAGSFGITLKCKEKSSNKIYALKQFKILKEENRRNFEKHLEYLLSMEKHPRIIELIKQFNDIDSSCLLIEYIGQASIISIIIKNGILSETETAKYAQQILEGLEYLHIHRIIHGNIKGSNILIDKNDNVKLSDFGLRTIFHNMTISNSFNEVLQLDIGALNWLSPEMIRDGQLMPTSDIWSFGAVMVEIITGKIPHYGLSIGQIVFAIMKGQIQFKCPVYYKDHIKSFINICLKVQPRERANFDVLYEHSFLK